MVCWSLRSELSPGRWLWPLVCTKNVLSPEAPCEGTAHCLAGGAGARGGLCGWSSHLSQPGSRALPSRDSDFHPGPLGPEMEEEAQEASEGGSGPAGDGAQTAPCSAGPSLLCSRARPRGSCRAFSGWCSRAVCSQPLSLVSGRALGALLLARHRGRGALRVLRCPPLPPSCAAGSLLLSAQQGHVGQD